MLFSKLQTLIFIFLLTTVNIREKDQTWEQKEILPMGFGFFKEKQHSKIVNEKYKCVSFLRKLLDFVQYLEHSFINTLKCICHCIWKIIDEIVDNICKIETKGIIFV
ncbi:uncharacterized protein LOC111633129 isoform X2 [Centruroides sculpturatus]|uniref:uncharacterized protein LOC111633129 isoform X2 n=1 Tax=Centruroides sculpturatus TaxID=218467 RepID=UPI000C6E9C38|nr:uncharacterized protein LOC111633129 isoform X2 [Centruroides sculpturatus]